MDWIANVSVRRVRMNERGKARVEWMVKSNEKCDFRFVVGKGIFFPKWWIEKMVMVGSTRRLYLCHDIILKESGNFADLPRRVIVNLSQLIRFPSNTEWEWRYGFSGTESIFWKASIFMTFLFPHQSFLKITFFLSFFFLRSFSFILNIYLPTRVIINELHTYINRLT